MKLGANLYFDIDNKKLDFLDKPVHFNDIEIGKITGTKYNKEKNCMEIIMSINNENINLIKKLLK